MRVFSLLLCFSLCLATTACENEGDFLPEVGATDPGGNPATPGDPTTGAQGGEITGTWKLVEANTTAESKSTIAGTETVTNQAGVLKKPSNYRWVITANPNSISSTGEVVIELTSTSGGIDLGTVDVPGDPTLNFITDYTRNGGLLNVATPGGRVDGTILVLNDSIFNLNVKWNVSVTAGGSDITTKNDNTYYFKR